MTSEEEQLSTEGNLVLATIRAFCDGAADLKTPNMTALMATLIESCVDTLAANTDPDTALRVLASILTRLGPRCKHGDVHIIHPASSTQ